MAAVVVLAGHLMGWSGVDTAAQVYRVDSFRRSGFQLWDFSWYGGHWTLDYSFLYPAIASVVGVAAVTVAAAAAASLAFEALARRHLGPGAVPAAAVFAVGTVVPASIGQLTWLAGAGFGLPVLWALDRRRHPLALALALAATLTSPLSGAFVAIAAAAVAVGDRRRMAWVLGTAVAAALPIAAAAVLFPGDGPMPYPVVDWLWEMVVAGALAALAALAGAARHRTLLAGLGLYALAATVAVAVPSALGGNVGRAEDLAALPLAVGLVWTRLRVLLPLAAAPLALSQWAPAWGALTSAAGQPSTQASFYAPLDRVLRSEGGPAGRVEVVPTEYHWESVYVAPVMPLARGWERQLDEARNRLFYSPGGPEGAAYRAWLVDNGVRFVALPSAPLDMAGRAEARLITAGQVPGLHPVWRAAGWRLYAVVGSPGIVSGPAELVSTAAGRVDLDVTGPGAVTVRVRWTPDWYVASGDGCLSAAGAWVALDAPAPGPVTLAVSPLERDRSRCPQEAAAAG